MLSKPQAGKLDNPQASLQQGLGPRSLTVSAGAASD
jgi:hypothetical protein